MYAAEHKTLAQRISLRELLAVGEAFQCRVRSHRSEEWGSSKVVIAIHREKGTLSGVILGCAQITDIGMQEGVIARGHRGGRIICPVRKYRTARSRNLFHTGRGCREIGATATCTVALVVFVGQGYVLKWNVYRTCLIVSLFVVTLTFHWRKV